MKKTILIFLLTYLISAITCFATTYYVDYVSGGDSNSGTSINAPWKRCPGMVGFSGSPSSLSPGDTVYF